MILTNTWQTVTLTAGTSTTIQNRSGEGVLLVTGAILPTDDNAGFLLQNEDVLVFNHTGDNLYAKVSQDGTGVIYVEGETTLGETLADPSIGEVTGTVTITDNSGETAEIYYTLDGKVPTKNDTLYTAPFVVTESVTVKTFAYKEGFFASDVVELDVVI